MIRIKHYTSNTDNHRTIELDQFEDIDRNTFLFKLLHTFQKQSDLETVIRWNSEFVMDLYDTKDVPYGIKSFIQRRPNLYMKIPCISIQRDMVKENDTLLWEDLIELPRPQSEQALIELINDYVARGLI